MHLITYPFKFKNHKKRNSILSRSLEYEINYVFDVYITKAAKYLPNEAVSNEEMEDYLGLINDTASKARRIILRNNKITNRYYAVDKNGKSTHSNAELTRNAIAQLFDENFTDQDLEVLSLRNFITRCFGAIACRNGSWFIKQICRIKFFYGNLLFRNECVEIWFSSIRSGNLKNAICTGSEKVSTWLSFSKIQSRNYQFKNFEEQTYNCLQKDFLRWMLSGWFLLFLLENKPSGEISLKIEWMEAYSYAFELENLHVCRWR